jgi:hypothetical protein
VSAALDFFVTLQTQLTELFERQKSRWKNLLGQILSRIVSRKSAFFPLRNAGKISAKTENF